MAPFIPSKKNNKKNKDESLSRKKKLRRNKADSDSSDNDGEGDDLIDSESITESSNYETVSESSESSYVPPKSKNKKSNQTRRRRIEDSEEESISAESESIRDSDTESESETVSESNTSNTTRSKSGDEDILQKDLVKIISKLFPSKYMKERSKQLRSKHFSKEFKEESDSDESSEEEKPRKRRVFKKKSRTSKSKHTKRSKKMESSDDESESENDNSSTDGDDEYDEEGDNDEENMFIFSIGGGDDRMANEYNDEGDDLECDSDDEKTFMKESYVPVEVPKPEEKSEIKKDSKRVTKTKSKNNKKKKMEEEEKSHELTDVEQEYLDLVETKKILTKQLQSNPKSKGRHTLMYAIDKCNKSIKKLVKKARIKNAKHYHKLIHDDPQNTDEVNYFKKNLSNKEQLRIMNDLKNINSNINQDKPYRIALLESNVPNKFKSVAMQKLNILRGMEPGDNEYYKIKNWVDTFMRIPFGVYKNLDINIHDGIDVCHNFMAKSKKILDECVYGLNDAKMQIMQMVGQWIANPSAMGTAIAIKGPMGTGKTSLVKEGISKILGREFAFIALGGTGDASFLEGHSYAYEGSSWGKIVQILIESKCMNPVIYFDELDKVSDTPRGEEIIGILTHLTDTTQNSQFHDKYFSDVDFDLSKCLFIFSYNDESKVNPILRDRMYKIQTKGYDAKEKTIIARDFLLPKIREQVNFKEGEIIIPDETIQYIVGNQSLTNEESGVRNLKRCLEIIHTKLNLFRLIKPEEKLFEKDIDLKVEFPMTVTKREVDALIKSEDQISKSMLMMYC